MYGVKISRISWRIIDTMHTKQILDTEECLVFAAMITIAIFINVGTKNIYACQHRG